MPSMSQRVTRKTPVVVEARHVHAARVMEAMHGFGAFDGQDGMSTMEMVNYTLNQYSDDFLKELTVLLSGDDVVARGVSNQIVEADVEYVINQAACFYPYLGIEEYAKADVLVRSMSQYQVIGDHPDLSKASDAVKEQCIAIMTATHLVSENVPRDEYDEGSHPLEYLITETYPWMIFKNEEIVTLIMERPKEAQRIARVIIEHGTTDTNEIIGIMEGVIPSLAIGAL